MQEKVHLHSRVQGSGPVLVLIHGLFGASRNFGSIANALASDFRIYTLDLRNHGKSGWHQEMDYVSCANDLIGFIETNVVGKVALLGHSMGGKIAMTLALMRPDILDKLIVVDIAPITYVNEHAIIIEAMLELDLSTLSGRDEADAMLANKIPERSVRLFLLQNLARRDGSYYWQVNLPVLASRLPELSAFPRFESNRNADINSLFLYGSQSDYVTTEGMQAIADYFPTATIEPLPSGHWPHIEVSDLFINKVSHFLASH